MKNEIAKPFLFIHIRKTAGMSLRGLLANLFPANRVLYQAHSVSGPQTPGDALFVTGHVDFDYAQRFTARPVIFTTVREPISRCLSTYYYFRSNHEQFFRTLATEVIAAEYQARRRFTDLSRELDLLQFLVKEEALARTWLSNVQTRQLAGNSCAGFPDDDPRLLEIALDHLNGCDLVGIAERLNDTLRLLGGMMNWGRLGPLQHINSTAHPRAAAIDPLCLEILRSWNTLDLILYEEACRLFELKLRAVDHKSPDDTFPDTSLLADGEKFTPDMRISGYGWHEREFHHDRWLCWNAATTATLYLRLLNSDYTRFECLLLHVINSVALDHLRISFNLIPLSLQKRQVGKDILVEGALPENALAKSARVAQITFHCPELWRPCDINPNSTDRRTMSVAIGRIRIERGA